MGDALAVKVQAVLKNANIDIDVVIPVCTFSVFEILKLIFSQVPDTSRVAALNLAQKLELPYREGFIKNRYVGRTFIMPGQQMRYTLPFLLASFLLSIHDAIR